jgi:sulfatase-like protein
MRQARAGFGRVVGGVVLAAGMWIAATRAPAQQADPSTAHAAGQQPNIVYIVADDLGWKDVGFHGSDIKTPNIDQLAAGGARLEQF